MSSPSNCCQTCDTPSVVNTPGAQGDPGTNGTNGADGINAFSVTTADFEIPLAGQDVTVSVVNSSWMTVGQVVVVAGPANFVVASKPTTTSAVLTFQGYEGDLNAGQTIAAGATVSPSGVQPSLPTNPAQQSGFGTGTAYTLTTTPAAVALGTSNPAIVLGTAGTWALFFFARIDFNGATYAAVKNCSFKLRRTNNTPADVTNSAHEFIMPIVTTVDHTAGLISIGPIPYATPNNDDAIALYGSIESDPDAGTVEVSDAYVCAMYVNTATS